jgi:hypothetical protein
MGQAVLKESKTQSTEIFTKYTNQLRNGGGYSAENGAVLLLLLFPEEDTRRKFGMLEARLSVLLVKILEERGVGGARVRNLKKWAGDSAMGSVGRAGCLGEELRRILQGDFGVSVFFTLGMGLMVCILHRRKRHTSLPSTISTRCWTNWLLIPSSLSFQIWREVYPRGPSLPC